MLSALLVAWAVQTSTQLPPQERENRNRLIVHYAKYQVYTALEILKILAIVHGYVLSVTELWYCPSSAWPTFGD